jgi:hypothetical protein
MCALFNPTVVLMTLKATQADLLFTLLIVDAPHNQIIVDSVQGFGHLTDLAGGAAGNTGSDSKSTDTCGKSSS